MNDVGIPDGATSCGDASLAGRSRRLALDLGCRTPLPASGATRERLDALVDLGREDLQLARLVEPHLDAVAILAEAGRRTPPERWYGVWASAPRPSLERDGDRLLLVGRQGFCSGATVCDAALVAADLDGRVQLVDVDLRVGRRDVTVVADIGDWSTAAFADTGTATVVYHAHPVPDESLVGDAGFYLERPGFWHGAIGPAAVWAGGAVGLVDLALRRGARTEAERVLVGEMRSSVWALRAELAYAAERNDAGADDVTSARRDALIVRNLVERHATRLVDLFGQLCGPRALALDPEAVTRTQELQLYVRQVDRLGDLHELGLDGPT